MGQVRLDDIHAAHLEQALEIPFGIQPLSCGNGNLAGSCNLAEAFHVLAEHRLLDEHGVVSLQLLSQDFSHGPVHPAVEINGNAKILPAA